jgi:hypothetical protein
MQIMRPYPQLLPPAPVTGVRVTGDFCCGNQSLHSLDFGPLSGRRGGVRQTLMRFSRLIVKDNNHQWPGDGSRSCREPGSPENCWRHRLPNASV